MIKAVVARDFIACVCSRIDAVQDSGAGVKGGV